MNTPGMIVHFTNLNEICIIYYVDFISVYWAYVGTPLKIRKFYGSWKQFLPKSNEYVVVEPC